MKLQKIIKKLTAGVLITTTVLGTVFSGSVSVKADSTDRVSSFIKMAKGDTITDEDISSLTNEELRFLGVYISNFYIPFGTELGATSSGDVTNQNKEDIKKALQTKLKYSDALADSLTETLLGLARSSVKSSGLSFYVSNKYHNGLKEVPNFSNNYLNFQRTMLGRVDDAIKKYNSSGVIKEIQEGKYKYGYWCYKKNGSVVPVMDCILDGSAYTPSQMAYFKCLEMVDITKGYGFSVLDFNGNDKADESAYTKITTELSGTEDLLKTTIWGVKMAVDCFGDIICMGANHQYIAIPGCMNPYTWTPVDSDGNDTSGAGSIFNMLNVQSMSMQEADNFLSSAVTSTGNTAGNDAVDASSSTKSFTYNLSKSASQLIAAGDAYNDSVIKHEDIPVLVTTDLADQNGKGKKFYKSLNYVLDYMGKSAVSSGDVVIRYSSSTGMIQITMAINKIEALDLNTLGSAWLEDPKRNKRKLKNFKENLEYLSHYGLDKTELSKEVNEMKSQARNAANSTNGSTTTGGGTDTILKTGIIKLNVLQDALGKTAADATAKENGYFSLRVSAGSVVTNIKTGAFWFKSDEAQSLIIEALKVFTGSNSSDKSYYYAGKEGKVDTGTKTIETAGPANSAFTGRVDTELSDTMIYIDNLGAYNPGEDSTYSAFVVSNYLKDDLTKTDTCSSIDFSNSDFKNTFSDLSGGKMSIPETVSDQSLVSIYVSYLWSCLYSSDAKNATVGKLGWRMSTDTLPTIPSDPLMISASAKTDIMLTSIRNWIYYLLNPTKGLEYFRVLVTNKLNAFLLGWHHDMLGTKGVGNTLGTTRYRNTTGYVTTPDLSEVEWTNSLINYYNNMIPVFIVFMLVMMVLAYVSGILNFQKSVFGFLIFVAVLLMPVNLINNAVGLSNRFSEKLYGEKFTYWALVQQESYATNIDTAATSGNYKNYLETLYNENSKVYYNQGGDSIVLKWQTPKKLTSLMYSTDAGYQSLTDSGKKMLNMFLRNQMTGENYTNNDDSTYMYRSYIDLANYSRYIYNGLKSGYRGYTKDINSRTTNYMDSCFKEILNNLGTNYSADRANGYTNANSGGSDASSGLKIHVPLLCPIVTRCLNDYNRIDNLSDTEVVGISPMLFNFSIPAFNQGGTSIVETIKESIGDNADRDRIIQDMGGYPEADYANLAAFSLYSENVFYYFSWDLYDMGMTPSSGTNEGFKNLILGQDNAGFFYNNTGTMANGELKDFMDMKSLFTYIIPYLRSLNDVVRKWDSVYGCYVYDGVPTEEGHWNDASISGDPEMKQKYWHNVNVARLYSIYTPWVDIMYDCSYAKGEYVNALGTKYYVEDPINPASYPEDRPMIFSESEMTSYGLTKADLTKVERRILECNQGMEERLYKLLDYYNFSDATMNTAAAINCAFEFNNTFSESGLFSDNHNIYPQSYELSDFSYDAFLRFILANSSGESLTNDGTNGSTDFYENIVNRSSMTSVFMMIILDIIGMYIIPFFKIAFLVGVFIVSVLIILCTSFRVDSNQRFIKRITIGVIQPVLLFTAETVGFAYVISLFMGSGNNAVTESSSVSIRMGSPATVLFAMIVINCVIVWLYACVLLGVVRSIRSYGKSAVGGVMGVIGGAVSVISSRVGSAFRGSGASGVSGAGAGGVSGSVDSGMNSRRAESRGNSAKSADFASKLKEDKEDTRRNDTKRSTIREDVNKPDSEEEKCNDLNKKTKEGKMRIKTKTSDSRPEETKENNQPTRPKSRVTSDERSRRTSRKADNSSTKE